jgi:hypothetical protein
VKADTRPRRSFEPQGAGRPRGADRTALTAAYASRPTEALHPDRHALAAEIVAIPEEAWHRARTEETAAHHRNSAAGETFTLRTHGTPVTYVRINGGHFRMSGDAGFSHAECLAQVARSPAYRDHHRGDDR